MALTFQSSRDCITDHVLLVVQQTFFSSEYKAHLPPECFTIATTNKQRKQQHCAAVVLYGNTTECMI